MKMILNDTYHTLGTLVFIASSIALGLLLAKGCLPNSLFAQVVGVIMFLTIYLWGMKLWVAKVTILIGQATTKGLLRSVLRSFWNVVLRRRERTFKTFLKNVADFQEDSLDEEKLNTDIAQACVVFRSVGLFLGMICGLLLGGLGSWLPDTRFVLLPEHIAFFDRFLDTAYFFQFQTSLVLAVMLIYTAAGWGYGMMLSWAARGGWLPFLVQ